MNPLGTIYQVVGSDLCRIFHTSLQKLVKPTRTLKPVDKPKVSETMFLERNETQLMSKIFLALRPFELVLMCTCMYTCACGLA